MRRWTLFSWSMLTLGVGLGAWWSYYTLGWGGWWAWDPVENAALMPWLIGTALLHTLPAAQKRGTLAGWTLFLAVAAFSLSLLGTFVVRSGLIASVHAFASDPTRGIFILAIFVLFAAGALALFAARAPRLPRAPLFAPLSREGGIVAADLLLIFAAAAVLAGTLFPLMAGGAAVDRSYFDRLTLWLAVPLILLAAAGPFLSWRRSEPAALRRPAYAAAAGLFAGLAALPFGSIGAAAGIGLAVFLAASLIPLRKNTGMMLAHFGLAVLIAGIAVSTAMRQEKTILLRPGETTVFAGYDVGLKRLYETAGANDTVLRADLMLTRNGKPAGSLTPAIRAFANPPLARAEAAIRTNLMRDLYAMPGEADGKGGFSVHLFYNPLQPWVFIGMALMAAGGELAFLRRTKAESAETAPPQKRKHRFVFALPLVVALAVAALLAIRLLPPGETPPDAIVGQTAPAFDLPALAGGPDLSLAGLEGKAAVVNFFASWCAPCQAEAPALRLLKTRGAPLYGIAYKDGKETARKFLVAAGSPYVAAAIDADGKAAAAFGATGVPETFVLDKNGIVRFHHAGPIDEKNVETDILPLLRRLE
jgi:cytochrome c-type biogenesis protein CcmF